ncbi:BON domain-containing protein [Simiduia curdlanivorans]|uniref:BON domain-containing protein n=1 Tax=Simiduia curdlanivorans TaxID=1492769 RepID=A0ABV8V8W1_9GAMM|nr:BON domain-containing protein [Simiduia curdlanivorans]MDN3638955.1 BON domain-containing protein [Simiduia curdlanivorans]
MRFALLLTTLMTSVLFISGCSHIVGAASETPIAQDPKQRSLGAALDDEKIEIATLVNLRKASPLLENANISVTSFNGIVLLTGQVQATDMKALAGEETRKVNRVREVHNELAIQGNSSVLTSTSDTWLTSKVKTKMMADMNLDSGRVKIVTESGVVYLMGLLTRKEANRAAEIARTTGGVQKVVKVVEYID